MERTNIRDLESLPERPDDRDDRRVVHLADAGAAGSHRARCAPGADIVALVKPQFEAGRDEVKRGGVVRDPLVHATVIGRVAWWCVNHGLRVRGVAMSPLLGPAGNREFFLWLRVDDDGTADFADDAD